MSPVRLHPLTLKYQLRLEGSGDVQRTIFIINEGLEV